MSKDVSQEIENSSNSTKYSETNSSPPKSIKKRDSKLLTSGGQNLVATAILPLRLPLLDKKDYVENWILSSGVNFSHDISEKMHRSSPPLRANIMRDKRVAGSPIHGHKSKRARSKVTMKENQRVETKKTSLFGLDGTMQSVRMDCTGEDISIIHSTPRSNVIRRDDFLTLTARKISHSLSWVGNGLIPNNAKDLKLNWSIGGHETMKINRCPISSDTNKPRQKTISFCSKNSSNTSDRVTCKFSWHRGKKMETKRPFALASKHDETQVQETLHLSKVSPRTDMSEDAWIKNYIAKDLDEDNGVDQKAESPLRWNGYWSQVPHAKNSNTPSLFSPIINGKQTISSTSTDDNYDRAVADSRAKIWSPYSSPVSKTCTKSAQAESPLRWNGYHDESCSCSKFMDFSSFSRENDNESIIRLRLTSDLSESNENFREERRKNTSSLISLNTYNEIGVSKKLRNIVSLSSPNIANDRSLISYENTPGMNLMMFHRNEKCLSAETRVKDFQDELPQKQKNEYRNTNCNVSKLSHTVLCSSLLIDDYKTTVVQSSTLNKAMEETIIKNQPAGRCLLALKKKPKKMNDIASMKSNYLPSRLGDSSKLLKIDYSLSPPIESIDVESSTTMPPDEDIEIDSCSDVTVNDVMDDTRLHHSIKRGSTRDHCQSSDSDETYCTNGYPVVHFQPKIDFSLKSITTISHLTTNDQRDTWGSRNENQAISSASSPSVNNSKQPICHVFPAKKTKNNAKRAKRAKKGSLVAKLQILVSHRTASFQLWQYKMSNPGEKRSQSVALEIIKRETRYGRHYLIGKVIEDFNNLLKSLRVSGNNSATIIPSDEKFITTLIIAPEISGTVKIHNGNTVRIYPPWDIIDQDMRALGIIYFDIDVQRNIPEQSLHGKTQVMKTERILDKFECPCIVGPAINESCHLKFNNTKPSIVTTIFADH